MIIRGKVHIEEAKNGRNMIIISEIPYQLNKKDFVEKIAALVNDKVIIGVADLRDESNKEGVRIVVELKRDSFPKKILNQLYKLTPLQTSFSFNMIALTDRGMQPRLFNLKEMLVAFLEHRREIITRRTRFDLAQAEARAHILEGFKKAISIIDEVIRLIRASKNREEGIPALMGEFDFSQKQAVAIWEMQLGKLSGLEIQKIEQELAEKLEAIADYKDILEKPIRVSNIISEEMMEVVKKYGDKRKTEVIAGAVGEFNPTDTIPNEDVVVTLSKNGYIKRVRASAFRTQRRG